MYHKKYYANKPVKVCESQSCNIFTVAQFPKSSHRLLHHIGLTSCNISHNLADITWLNVEN